MMAEEHNVTRVLSRIEAGDESAADQLLPLVYKELRKLAAARMAKTPPGQTLQPTALVHEAYLRVIGMGAPKGWSGRKHFFFAAARAMRDILVEQARHKASLKRGGDRRREELHEVAFVIEPPNEDVLELDSALTKLEEEDSESAQIVMLRYFSGLTIEETADVLDLSVSTVKRRWRFVRAWFRRELGASDSADGGPGE